MRTPSEQDGLIALRDHVAERARSARVQHGPSIDAESIMRVLDDRKAVRYPVSVVFDDARLQPGEFAWPQPLGDHPSEGYRLFVHPTFEHRPETWAMLIAYHIPTINYGDIVTHEEAEIYAATLLAMKQEHYYSALCELADELRVACETGGAP